MTDDSLDETIRGAMADDLRRKIAELKAKTDGLHDFMVEEEKRQGELILIEATTLIHPDQLDTLKRVGFGTCHIQQPDGAMKLVSVSVVKPQVDPWERDEVTANLKAKGESHMDTPQYVSHPKFEPERWHYMTKEEADAARFVNGPSPHNQVFNAIQDKDTPKHVRDWMLKQTWLVDMPPDIRAKQILDVAHRMIKGEPPFVDSEGKPVAWSYLDDNGWPHTVDGRLVDVPIVPTQALREDRAKSDVARLVEAHKTLQHLEWAESEGVTPTGYIVGTPEPSLLRRLWLRWVHFWEHGE